MRPSWNATKPSQLASSCSKEPKLNGSSPWKPLSWGTSFDGASRSHTRGMTKNTAKNAAIRNAVTRPSQRPGARSERTSDRLVAVKESSPEDEDGGKAPRHDQQEDRDRGGAVEVRLRAERGDVCELIERIVVRDLVPARLAEDPGFREQLASDGDRDDGHVRDPLPHQRY